MDTDWVGKQVPLDNVNLIICTTPLQALIARRLINRHNQIQQKFDVLMIHFYGENKDKFQYYFDKIAQLCRYADFISLPRNKWKRIFFIPKLLRKLQLQYNTVFVSNIDSHEIQYILSRIQFNILETFDDGTGNLVLSSVFYHNNTNWQRQLMNRLRGIRLQTEDLRRLSQRHHTLYPNQPNIVEPIVPLDLWGEAEWKLPESSLQPKTEPIYTRRILLGQPLLPNAEDNAVLIKTLLHRFRINEYFPHPRETYRIPGIEYIDSPLIFEDYLLENLQQQLDTCFEVYHFFSTAALNVYAFPRTAIYAVRSAQAAFHTPGAEQIYQVMAQLGIPIIDIE